MAAGLTLPALALVYLPVLQAEQQRLWPTFHTPAYFAAQVEQESCVSLKSKRCWSPHAELRTSRERGVGLGQITKTARFDALAEMRAAHPVELAGWSWADPYKPEMQLRALVLKNRDNWKRLRGMMADDEHGTAAMLVAYNGGVGRVLADRNLCSNTPGCDRTRWWGNIEHTSLLKRTTVKGYGKSFFDINREYPRLIMKVRVQKYVPWFNRKA